MVQRVNGIDELFKSLSALDNKISRSVESLNTLHQQRQALVDQIANLLPVGKTSYTFIYRNRMITLKRQMGGGHFTLEESTPPIIRAT